MESQAGPNRLAKPQQALGEPFDSAYAVEQALQTRDPAALQAGKPLLAPYSPIVHS